jgi:hypothetical protein
MTASALTIPEPLPDDPDAVTTALETAAIFGTQGDTREALRWLRRAAEAAGDEGNDLRALTLARLAADMSSQISADGAAAATAASSTGNASNGSSTAGDAAAAAIRAANAEVVAPRASAMPDLGLAPTVAAQPPPIASPSEASLVGSVSEARLPPVPGGDGQATAAPLPAPPAWAPPAPPPIVTAAFAPDLASDAISPVGAELPASNGDTALASAAAPPSSGSLREVLQRFSPSSVPSGASQPSQPDPQQTPALAALVQSIVQSTPRSQPVPGGGSPISARPAAVSARVQTQPVAPRAVASPEPKTLAPEAGAELTPSGLGPQSDPLSDAITDPRLVPPVFAKPESDPFQVKTPVLGLRQAVRASIAATTEEGVFILELLKDGQPATGHEALVVLVDPNANLFE